MGELYYIVCLVDGEVFQTGDRDTAKQYVENPEYVVINDSLGVFYNTDGEDCGIPHI